MFYIRREGTIVKDQKIGFQWWHGLNIFIRDGGCICKIGHHARVDNGKLISIVTNFNHMDRPMVNKNDT